MLLSGQIGVCRGLAIAKPRLPLTRELSSKARLRERKGCAFMRFHFSPSVFLLTQKATSLVRGRQGRLLNLHPYKPRFGYLQPLLVSNGYLISISSQSSFLIAITAPLIKNALGSPAGLLPTHSTTVSGVRPISSRRCRILPFVSSAAISAYSPMSMLLRFFVVSASLSY